jgi:hypothetical protein
VSFTAPLVCTRVPDEMPGGHMAMLSRPREVAERLEAYRLAPAP